MGKFFYFTRSCLRTFLCTQFRVGLQRSKIVLLIIFLGGNSCLIFSQQITLSPQAKNQLFESYLTDKVSDVKVDANGFVWVVTFSEIIRYDGKNIYKINSSTVSHDSFIRFYQNKSEEIFITDLYGAVYSIENNQLHEFKGNQLIKEKNIANKIIDIYKTSDTLKVSVFQNGLLFFRDGKLIEKSNNYLDKYGFVCVLDKKESPFLLKNNNEKSNSTTFTTIDANDKVIDHVLLGKSKGYYKNSMVNLSDGEYLISTGEGHLLRLNKEGKISVLPFSIPIVKLFKDSRNNIWMSTLKEGVFLLRYNNTSNLIIPYNIFSKNQLIISAEDQEGNLWGYSELKGVYKILNPIFFHLYFNEEDPSSEIEAAEYFENQLLISTSGSLIGSINLNDKNFQKLLEPNPSLNKITGLKKDTLNSRVWVGARGKLGYINLNGEYNSTSTKKITKYSKGRPFHFESSKPSNRAYIAGFHRNLYFHIKDTSIDFVSDTFPSFIKNVIVHNDSTFIITENSLFLEFDKRRVNLSEKYIELKSGVSDLKINNNKVWIASKQSGVFQLELDSLHEIKYSNLRIRNAQIEVQNKNNLWLFSNQGSFLVKNRKNKSEVIAYQKLPNKSISRLLSSNEFLFMITKTDGILGVRFDELIRYPLKTPTVFFNSLKFGNLDYTHLVDSNIELTYLSNSLHLNYTAINFSNEKTSYRYKVNKLNSEWTITEDQSLNIYNIPNNSYDLEVQARIGVQPWGDSKLIQFRITPPFYKTWWFITLIVTLLGALLYLFSRYKIVSSNQRKSLIISRLKAEQKALRTRMDPHFMFNIISSLQYLILKKKNDDASLFLNRFALIMRNNLKQTESDKISLEDEIQFLKEYIELEKMRFEDHFNFSIEVENWIDQKTMIPTFLIQPLVENSIKHGFENFNDNITLKLSFKLHEDFLIVEVEDDGVGYYKSIERKADIELSKKDSYGLSTIKERIELYNGKINGESFELIDLKNTSAQKRGTLVRVRIKLN